MSQNIDIKSRVIEAMSKGWLISLATVDSGGVWVADVVYTYDKDLNIYWMSDPDVRHSQAILTNSQVAGTVTASMVAGEKNLGIQLAGKAQKIDGARYDIAVNYFTKRGKPIPKESDDVLQGDSWYMITPTKIELIDQENFGFEKKILI